MSLSEVLELLLLTLQFAFTTAASISKTQKDSGRPTKWGLFVIFGALIITFINIYVYVDKNLEEKRDKILIQENQHKIDSIQIANQNKILDSLSITLKETNSIYNQTQKSLKQQENLMVNTQRVLNPFFPMDVHIEMSISSRNPYLKKFMYSIYSDLLKPNVDWYGSAEVDPEGGSLVRTAITVFDNNPLFEKFERLVNGIGLSYTIGFYSKKPTQEELENADIECWIPFNDEKYHRSLTIQLDQQIVHLSLNVNDVVPNVVRKQTITGIIDLKNKYLSISTGKYLDNKKFIDNNVHFYRISFSTGSNQSLEAEYLLYQAEPIVSNKLSYWVFSLNDFKNALPF